MSYRVELARSADRELWRLPEPYRTKVFRVIKLLGEDPRSSGSKKLKGSKDAWRIRLGPYRILYTVQDVLRIVRVESVGDRKDVYR
ncbi:MAG TPA: type II toxin-antitoxin system RelE/ParE family toxin [Flavobacteriales bacterium]|nr:type II toxin-antitoxin system RelE/ParE family toxin [Flavobacteriales bacterium]HRN35604.1 type II toxin-antitoxin system RelE/ParE family toxin [Flavobacteriales bacterium]HRO38839.1 type II toxin-antitoxin system RelE/ParE family toxin [Flavobacteriales bacterium]HRP81661.1 type II toxin-antitoxin system RelE/ParE family toxin [Flavobacteriales bacterium]HRQ84000.1 type II toxin-antitoxin system RelE/ParE family toxin [Flavobacteriales bacterium]